MANYNNVIYSFVSYRRNIKDMPFVSKLTDGELAVGVSRCLSEIFGDEFEFKSLKNLPLEECKKLEDKEIITKELTENKDISAYAFNEDKTKKILINEEDHIRLIASKSGFCLEDCFTLANKMDDQVVEKLNVCFNNNLGYLTANPEYFGTGMHIGCVLFLPALWHNKKIKKLMGELLAGEFEFLDVNGLNYSGNSPFIKVQNIRTFGHKENEFAVLLQKLVVKLLELEETEENKTFNLSASSLADIIFRAYGEMCNCYRIAYAEAEQKLGFILWGINLKMLNFKKRFDIYSFLATIKENHIALNSNVKEAEKQRAKILAGKLLECVQKGEIDV